MKLEGIYAPISTPFSENGDIHYEALQQNLAKWKNAGLDGLVVCGSNGELPFIELDERVKLTQICKKEMQGKARIVTGIHYPSTRETIACAKAVADAGCEAGLLLPPSYFKGQGMPGVIHYFEEVANASPIPLILYNMPGNTGVNMDAATMLHLGKHPNIIGVKDTAGDMTQLGTICARAPEGFSVFAGSANYLLPALSLGVAGGTLAAANLYPVSCRKLIDLYKEGKMGEARLLQYKLLAISDAITRRFGVPGLKVAMDSRNLFGGPCRSPLMPVSESVKTEILKVLDEAGLDSLETWR